MKQIIIILLSVILAVCACSPIPMTVVVEMKDNSDVKMDLKGTSPAIVNISPKGDKDSSLLSLISFGMAEKIEEDAGFQAGSIPVFSLYSEEVDTDDLSSIPYLFSVTGEEKIIVMDSLSIGDYEVVHPDTKAFVDDDFYSQIVVNLPFHLDFKVFKVDSLGPECVVTFVDSLTWTLLSKKDVEDVQAIAKANSSLRQTFKKMGNELGSMFSPQWIEQERMLIVYEEESWLDAFEKASSFLWNDAMDIWLDKVKTENPKRASYAAYNIAVACEMLEHYDLALEWLDFAKSKYPFYELELQRNNVKEAASR